MSRPTAIITFLLIATVIVTLDLWTKVAVFDLLDARLINGNAISSHEHQVLEEFSIFPGWKFGFSLQAAANKGAFNGWFAGMRWLLLGVSALWVFGTLGFVARCARSERLLTIALALTAGGAAGNLWDRYHFAAVRDFVKWYVVHDGGMHVWPNFNIADSCIVAGVGLILIREYRVGRELRRAKKLEEQQAASTAAD